MGQVDEVNAVGERLGEFVPDPEREPRLADASCAGQGHQPHAAPQQFRQLGDLGAAADERRLRRRQVPSRPHVGRLDGERRIVPENRLLQLLQFGSRLEAELVLHRLACPPKRLERRLLPIAPVEGEHQLPAEPLAATVLRDQRLELGNKIAMAAERQVGVDPVLERGQPQFLQPGRLGLRERFVLNVLVRRAAPQLERLAKARRRRIGVPLLQLRPAACRQQLESFEIQLAGLEAQSIPGPLERDPLWAQGPAQRVHVHLEGVRSAGGRPLTPERVDQPVA